jgi:Collagen triple helix repeat (20 copies)
VKAVIAAAIVAALISAMSATAAFVVTSANIKNGTIKLADISPGAKRALRGQRGPRGFTGAPGAQGVQGAQGERGLQGERGPQGERGAAGTAVATRVRSTREVTTGSGSSVLWPMVGNLWTQRADSTHLLVGQVQVRYPAACDGTGEYPSYGYLNVIIDGEYVGSAYAGWYAGSAGHTQTLGVSFYPSTALLAPGDELTRVMAVRVSDTCTGAGQDFTFESFKVDVIAAS